MSAIEDARFALLRAAEKAQQVGGAIQQGTMELGEIDGLLIQAGGANGTGATHEAYREGSMALIHARDRLNEAMQLVRVGIDNLETYAQQL